VIDQLHASCTVLPVREVCTNSAGGHSERDSEEKWMPLLSIDQSNSRCSDRSQPLLNDLSLIFSGHSFHSEVKYITFCHLYSRAFRIEDVRLL
jgi:hypothetical protein